MSSVMCQNGQCDHRVRTARDGVTVQCVHESPETSRSAQLNFPDKKCLRKTVTILFAQVEPQTDMTDK